MPSLAKKSSPAAPVSELCFLDAVALATAIRKRQLSVHEVISAHIAQCERTNPRVNAIVTPTYEAALQDAEACDVLLAHGHEPGPLFGLPVAHKDSFLTQGVRTTFGSAAYADNVPARDSAVVARQKHAGAIGLGKTNMPEFGAGSHTFNAVFGATRNPYRSDVTAGGSSGGAAAALACGMVALADGSDMGGSLRNPASFCNVVGLRPSIGRVPMAPSAYPFNTLTVGGPMGRSVADVALLLDAIAGHDPEDPLSVARPDHGFGLPALQETRGLRIALSPTLGGLPFEAPVRQALREGVAHLEAMGCHVEEDEPDFSDADFAFETLRALAFATNYGPVRELKGDLLKASVRWNIDLGLALDGKAIAEAERARARMFTRMQALLTRHDFLVAPVSQVVPFDLMQEYPQAIDGEPMPHYIGWMRSCCRLTVTGHPAISLPCSFTPDGLPIGIQIVGRFRQERALLAFARQFEAANPAGRRRPRP
ncbi:amidase [Acidovorax cavernicola]|uniref:Amidase n=1 Tax=Acidovorax cavernicola TaxID=1675792 RepID=A0A9X8D4A4_9BURK|nr:amidase [Acidovorax cavernicola]RIX79066.1 amidase [Acidovorax cavernicola]